MTALPEDFDLTKTVSLLSTIDFGQLDQNDDFALSLDEFGEALTRCGIPDGWVAQTLFLEIDTNEDGEISPSEFFAWRSKHGEDHIKRVLIDHYDELQKPRRKTGAASTVEIAEDINDAGDGDASMKAPSADSDGDDGPRASVVIVKSEEVKKIKEDPEKDEVIPTTATEVDDAVDAVVELLGTDYGEEDETGTKEDESNKTDPKKEDVSSPQIVVDPPSELTEQVTVEINEQQRPLELTVSDQSGAATASVELQTPSPDAAKGNDDAKKGSKKTDDSSATGAGSNTSDDDDDDTDLESGDYEELNVESNGLDNNDDKKTDDGGGGIQIKIGGLTKGKSGKLSGLGKSGNEDGGLTPSSQRDELADNEWSRSLENEEDTDDEQDQNFGENIMAALDFGALLKRNKSEYLKLRQQEEEEEARLEEEAEKALEQAIFSEQFDLSLGLLRREDSEIYENNFRPLIYTSINIVLVLPSLFYLQWYYMFPPFFLNVLVFILGLFSEISFNIAEMCCGECGRNLFKYRPGTLHYSALDAWFNIEAYREKGAGHAMVSETMLETKNKKTKESALQEELMSHLNANITHRGSVAAGEMVVPSDLGLNSRSPGSAVTPSGNSHNNNKVSKDPHETPIVEENDNENENEKLTKKQLKAEKKLERKLEKQREKLSDMQIVPPPFSRTLVLGWALVDAILMFSGGYYSNSFSLLEPFDAPKGTPKRWSWESYCTGGNRSDSTIAMCLIRYSAFLSIAAFGSFCAFCSIVLFRNLKKIPLSMIKVAQQGLLNKFPPHGNDDDDSMMASPGAAGLLAKIERELLTINSIKHYKTGFTLCSIKFRVHYMSLILNIFCIFLVLIPIAIVRPKWLFNINPIKNIWPCVIFLLSICIAVHNLSQFFGIMLRIYNFYQTSYKVMRVLGEPLVVNQIEDLMIWWEVRKYFLSYRLPVLYIYGSWGVAFLSVFTLLAIGLVVVNILLAEGRAAIQAAIGEPFNFTLTALVVIMCFSLFQLLKLVVETTGEQEQHTQMLRHELVRLDAYGALFSRRLQEKKQKKLKERQLQAEREAREREREQSRVERSRLGTLHQRTKSKSAVDSLLSFDDDDMQINNEFVANQIINSFDPRMSAAAAAHGRRGTVVDPSTLELDEDLKTEQRIATVGRDSHKLILSMLYIIEELDVKPTVMGLELSKTRLALIVGYLISAALAVLGKVLFDID